MAVYKDPLLYTKMSLPNAINRTEPHPVDSSLVWNSKESLLDYAANSPVAYVGQILSLINNDPIPSATAYIIKDEAGTIEEVGSATLGDEKGISLENGTLSLKNWGKKFFKRDPAHEGEYIEVTVDESNPWQAGLQPRVYHDGTNFVLAWYEPSTQTIEGVDAAVSSLSTTVSGITATIGSADDEPAANTIYGSINGLKSANEAQDETISKLLPLAGGTMTGDITLPDGGKAISDTAVTTQINNAINSAGHLKRAIVESLPEINDTLDTEAIYMVLDGLNETGNIYDEYMVINGAWEKIGDTTIDLTNYLQKVAGATEGNLTTLNANGELLDSGLAATDVSSHISNTTVHITAEERTKWNEASTAVAANTQSIADLVKISQEDADKLAALPAIKSIGDGLSLDASTGALTATTYELPAATAEKIGGIKVAATSTSGLSLAADGGLAISISATANGLKKNSDGLALEIATADAPGAMSAAMVSKLAGITEGAQPNTVEGALLGGIAASINDKQIVIPLASTTAAGLVYSSAADNGVAVDASGLMSVNRISTSKLYVPEGEELVLSGGNSQVN